MPTRIDHVIAAAADFPALEAAFARLGFTLTGGGTHPHLGTRNRIVVLGEGYLELLSIADAARVSPVLARRLANGGSGWVGFALQSSAIMAEAADMRSRTIDVRGPHPGRLVSPGGAVRGWQTVTLASDDLWAAAEPLPFLIQHDTSGAAHQAELAGTNHLTPHANGARRLHAVTLAVHDLATTAHYFAQVYGLHPSSEPCAEELLHAEITALPLSLDGERIELASPTGPGIVRQRLETAGEGVCSIAIEVASLADTQHYLRDQNIAFTVAAGALWLAPAETLAIPLRFVAEPAEVTP